MKIAVFSDSHGNISGMERVVGEVKPERIVHLGDCVKDAQRLHGLFPEIKLYSVAGNCDWSPETPESLFIEEEGVRIFMAHGHRHGVKLSLDGFMNSVCCSGAQLGLFGHTHRAQCNEAYGICLMNPGSCGMGQRPTYGVIELENGKFNCKINEI